MITCVPGDWIHYDYFDAYTESRYVRHGLVIGTQHKNSRIGPIPQLRVMYISGKQVKFNLIVPSQIREVIAKYPHLPEDKLSELRAGALSRARSYTSEIVEYTERISNLKESKAALLRCVGLADADDIIELEQPRTLNLEEL